MLDAYIPREVRKWLYGISMSVMPLLVMFGVITEQAAPLWIALVGSILTPAMALNNLTPAPVQVEPEDDGL